MKASTAAMARECRIVVASPSQAADLPTPRHTLPST
jgi:hypothetical protein